MTSRIGNSLPTTALLDLREKGRLRTSKPTICRLKWIVSSVPIPVIHVGGPYPHLRIQTAGAVCKSKARADSGSLSTSRSARGLLPHYGENSLSPPSVAVHDTFELGPAVRCHAEAIDNDVGDLISAIEGAQTPIHSDRLSRQVAFPRPSAGPADEFTDND